MIRFRKIKLKKILKSPVTLGLLAVLLVPIIWMAATAVTYAGYTAGLTHHLGTSRGYVTSFKVSNFFTLPFERIDLSYGYGSSIFWVPEGAEIYINYSAVNYGDDAVSFTISDYVPLRNNDQFTFAKVEGSDSGTVLHRAEKSGFYNIRIIPRRLISAGEDISYRYKMSWGARQP